MKATKLFYLSVRNVLIQYGFNTEVQQLDNHFELNFVYNKNNKIIKIY